MGFMRQLMLGICLGVGLCGFSARAEMCADLPSQLKFEGDFGAVSASSLECERLFSVKHYETEHFRVGPTGRTSVLHFRSAQPAAFLDKTSLIGLLGPDCEFGAEKKIETGGKEYRVSWDGMVDPDVILVTVQVRVFQFGTELCHAKAEYTGF